MLTGKEITSLVELLCRRDVSLWHACQFVDFCSYINLGGIPSRRLLEESGERFTAFDTDGDDKRNGVWHRVFANPEDHGNYFASGKGWTPNPYGPIQIQIRPSVLCRADDVAWTRRSAGARDFALHSECIDDISIINSLFKFADLRAPDEKRSELHSTFRIREILQYDRAGRPEMNCQMHDELLPIDYWSAVRVDQHHVAGTLLRTTVNEVLSESTANIRVFNRTIKSDRKKIFREMSDKIAAGPHGIRAMVDDPSISRDLRLYLNEIIESDLVYQFNRWERYVYSGTLQPLRERIE